MTRTPRRRDGDDAADIGPDCTYVLVVCVTAKPRLLREGETDD